jgi:hypothetical protein
MKPTETEILLLLKNLVHECQEHNSEYHHMTSARLMNEALNTIENMEKDNC